MNKIEKELTAIVVKNLPEATAGEMKKFIEEAGHVKRDLKFANKEIDKHCEKIKSLAKERDIYLEKYESLQNKYTDFDAELKTFSFREKQLAEDELRLQNTILQNKLENSENSKNDILNLVQKVFGHPGVTVTTERDKSVPDHYDSNNQWVSGVNIQTDTETTRPIKE